MRRKLNPRPLLTVLAAVVVAGLFIHLAHELQVRRHARALLRQADRAEEAGQTDAVAGYLGRYLAARPNDHAARARRGIILAKRARTPADAQAAAAELEQAVR